MTEPLSTDSPNHELHTKINLPSRKSNSLVGDTSYVDISLSHGNKPLPATTTNNNLETPTALHHG